MDVTDSNITDALEAVIVGLAGSEVFDLPFSSFGIVSVVPATWGSCSFDIM